MKPDVLWNAALGFALFFSAIILFATGVKAWEVWRTRRWFPVRGNVISTRVVQRKIGGRQDTAGNRRGNYPEVVYEYTVDGRSLRGKRVNVSPHIADVEVEPVLNRYPVGTEVAVFVNPKDFQDSVLERDWPRGLGLAVLGLIGALFALAYGIPWLLTRAEHELALHLPQPGRAWVVVLAGAVSLFVLWLWGAIRAEQTRALAWPTVRGEIVNSSIEAFLLPDRKSGEIRSVAFRPVVLYRYQVGNRWYEGERITIGGKVTGAIRSSRREPDVAIVDKTNGRAEDYAPPGWMFELVRKYPQAAIVDVSHDPAQPASSVLEPIAAGSQWFLLLVAGCFLGIAVWGAVA